MQTFDLMPADGVEPPDLLYRTTGVAVRGVLQGFEG